MAKAVKRKVAFISSFLPRKCGIATFTSDLIENTASAAKDEFEPLVVAMRSDSDLRYDDPVKFEIRQNVKSDYICAADYINFSHVDVVSVQHEFGLFGGDAGSHLPLLLNKVYPCHEVVKIDYHLQGCPPPADTIWAALTALLTDKPVELPYELIKYD